MQLHFTIRGENIEVTPAIRSYIEEKVSKIDRYFDRDFETNVHVNVKTYSDNTAKCEVTIPLPQITVRAEETSENLYGSIDLVVDKLERQIRKHKTKLNRKSRETGLPEIKTNDEEPESNEQEIKIVRTKQISLKPMGEEEAVLQMEMLGHDFFIYEDADTMGTSIVYRRRDGDYGLIQTDVEA